jgi:bisphosphoglycerate-dependent phosphoglycerate mutase
MSTSEDGMEPEPEDGMEPENYLSVTHNNRLSELIKEYSKNSYSISNCEIIKFSFNGNKEIIQIMSIYKPDKNGKSGEKVVLFENKNNSNDKNNNSNDKNIKYIFYAVRHGEGIHNVNQVLAKINSSYTDPKLSDKGKEQSLDAGKYFKTLHVNIKKYFVSTLFRTTETLYNFLKGMRETGETGDIKAIVLPESEEFSKSFVQGYENKSSCLFVEDRNENKCLSYQENDNKLKIILDWKYVDEYNKKYIDAKSVIKNITNMFKVNSDNPKKPNMFINAIRIIETENKTQGGKGFSSNKKKKTRRMKYKNKKINKKNVSHRKHNN